MTEQSTDTTKDQLDEPVSFIGVNYRSMDEASLTGAEMTQRQLHRQSHPTMGDRQLTKLGIWSALHSLQGPLQAGEALSRSLGWFKPLPD